MSIVIYDFKIESAIRKLDNDFKIALSETAEEFFRKMFSEYFCYCRSGVFLHSEYPLLSRKNSINYIIKKYTLSKPEFLGTPIFEELDDQ